MVCAPSQPTRLIPPLPPFPTPRHRSCPGGQGAPLLPWVDFLLYQHAERGRVLLNIGGIANVTVLPPGGAAHNVVAFDTGPGNMCMDLAVSRFTQGASRMDGGGARAGAGTVNRALLQQLKQHPYFARGPPKSTGHEDFGAAFVDKLLAEAAEAGVVEDDVLATLAMLTAETVAEAVQQHCAPRCGPGGVAELWVAGGGVHNATVMQFIRDKLATVKVDTFEGETERRGGEREREKSMPTSAWLFGPAR